jgi:hypothetical protein
VLTFGANENEIGRTEIRLNACLIKCSATISGTSNRTTGVSPNSGPAQQSPPVGQSNAQDALRFRQRSAS